MKHSTYQKLYQAHLGVIDKKGLLESRKDESDPFYQNLIDLVVETKFPYVEWDVKPFTVDFLSGFPRQRLDETFFAFVLRIATIIKEESYVRAYKKPESHMALIAWMSILRSVLYSGLGLLYDVKWTPATIFSYLEPAVIKLVADGDARTLRQLMTDMGITLTQDDPYPAEKSFEKLNFLQTHQFGSFFWRFLHWMAEADAVRGEDAKPYKQEWRQLLKGPLYRTLRCGICMTHFYKMMEEFDKQLDGDLSRLFFTIHNRTHAYRREVFTTLQEPDYLEAQFEQDVVFMRKALLDVV